MQNMNNKMVQPKLYTDPKDDPQHPYPFAVAYEGGTIQNKTFEGASGAKDIKQKPVLTLPNEKITARDMDLYLHKTIWQYAKQK